MGEGRRRSDGGVEQGGAERAPGTSRPALEASRGAGRGGREEAAEETETKRRRRRRRWRRAR